MWFPTTAREGEAGGPAAQGGRGGRANPSGRVSWRRGVQVMSRSLWVMLALVAASGVVRAAPGAEAWQDDVSAAQEALKANLALGGSLQGQPVTGEQAAQAQRLVEQGLARARKVVAEYPRVGEAHCLVGLLLCAAYRPTRLKKITTDQTTGELVESVATVLRRGNQDGAQREEGLAELRAALRLEPRNVGWQLDYAEGLLICGQAEQAAGQLSALWQRRSNLAGEHRLRAARLLAQTSAALNRPGEERRWLREILKLDPKDRQAAKRLAELVPPPGAGITWLSYEEGMAVAKQEHKSVMADFTATWCGWCRKLDEDVFSNPEVIALSREFACVRVWEDKRPDLVRRYGVRAYPAVLFLDAAGQVRHQVVGYKPVQPFLSDMKKGLGQ